MNTIALLRTKGLSYEEIEQVMHARASRQIRDAYSTGFKEGMSTALANLIEAAKYVNQTNKELRA